MGLLVQIQSSVETISEILNFAIPTKPFAEVWFRSVNHYVKYYQDDEKNYASSEH